MDVRSTFTGGEASPSRHSERGGREAFPTVPDLVARAARRTPDAVALAAGERRLTYGELDRRADGLAARLRRLGVGPEAPVGLALGRSFERIVAALAVWRAGSAFVALDPAWPDERLRGLLDDAGASAVFAQTPERLAAATRIGLGPELAAAALGDPEPEPLAIAPESLAYVVYTSGSTGAPKGVEITHAALSNLVLWHDEAFEVRAADRGSHLAGLGFDAAIWEVWPYLAAGASLVLADEAVRTSADALQAWLVRHAVTHAFVPTALAEPMLAAPWPERTALRRLLTGADTLHRRPPPGLPFVLVNNYGPSECAVVASSAEVPPGAEEDGLPPIGRPIAGTQIHLLGPDGAPVADGEVGEIHVGGAGVGRGYRNRPDLTAERFLPDPFSDVPGARLYRTGDLGRRRPDGQIEFRGRTDAQVKIRGHRVEPDEIAAALTRHPKVAAAAVRAWGEAACERALAAYVVPTEGGTPTPLELREFLAAALPDFMVPSSFVRLEALPLTSNGKLDRAALPAPTYEDSAGRARSRPPESPTEQRIAEIVAKVLGLEQVGAEDNFFLLGGHSLLATQVVMLARSAFGVELTLRHLFEAQTVANLATAVEDLLIEELAAMSEDEANRLAAG